MLAKLEKEAALNKYAAAAKVLVERQMDDPFVDLCDAECQTICSCQQVRTSPYLACFLLWIWKELTFEASCFHSLICCRLLYETQGLANH